MARLKLPSLGQKEMELLHFIIERQGASVRDATEKFGITHGLARTTVLTMMERLRKKGYLKRSDNTSEGGRGNFYTPSSPPSELMTGAVKAFVEKALGGSVSPLVAYLAEQVEVSDDEMDELKKLIARLETKKDGEDR